MGTASAIFMKGNKFCDFLFASIDDYAQPKRDLLLKRQTKIAADDILIFFFYLSKKIRLNISCESSASA